MQPLHNTTLDQNGQCSTEYKHDFTKTYKCSNLDPKDIGNLIIVELGSGYQLDQVYLIANPGD